ncbi:MAG: RNA 2',3'-cyclic phosphodiesterase [Verrucomicrobia bacterium]|nr:RNA 2',3'-cyclic phosphodiesterase [Verrucomicrobiota bacterium]
MRAFIAVRIEPALLAEVGRVQRQLEAAVPANSVRWTRPDQIHLTLKFLGEVAGERVDELGRNLRQACADVRALPLSLEGAGCFPGPRNPRVVWVGIAGEVEALRRLQTRVELHTAAFGAHSAEREFRPHLTIGRVKARDGRTARGIGDAIQTATIGRVGEWTVREVVLFQSQLTPQAAIHTELAVVPLVG